LSVVFFTDRDLGLSFPEILAAGGLTVERPLHHFAPDRLGCEWLAAAAGHAELWYPRYA
jgi:hypothetical protein